LQVLAAFTLLKMLLMMWNFCQNKGTGMPKLVVVVYEA